jgi:hypothetical protein
VPGGPTEAGPLAALHGHATAELVARSRMAVRPASSGAWVLTSLIGLGSVSLVSWADPDRGMCTPQSRQAGSQG